VLIAGRDHPGSTRALAGGLDKRGLSKDERKRFSNSSTVNAIVRDHGSVGACWRDKALARAGAVSPRASERVTQLGAFVVQSRQIEMQLGEQPLCARGPSLLAYHAPLS
jgi:hypothetical protein